MDTKSGDWLGGATLISVIGAAPSIEAARVESETTFRRVMLQQLGWQLADV